MTLPRSCAATGRREVSERRAVKSARYLASLGVVARAVACGDHWHVVRVEPARMSREEA